MKNKVSVFVIAFVVMAVIISCNKNTDNPAPEPTLSMTPDNAVYSFEDGTVMNWVKGDGGVTAITNSTDRSYLGRRSLRIQGSFTGGTGNAVRVEPPAVADMTGMKIIARLYIPSDAPTIGGSIFIQSGAGMSCWEQGPWVNSFTKGGWTTLQFDVAYPDYVSGTNPDHTNVGRLGINMQPGANYTGYIYIDSVDIVVAGTPTNTPTISPTHTVSPTATETITGTPPTATVTSTITQTPTLISTPQPPNDPNIHYYGRWNHANPLQPKVGWGANYIVAGFEGTSVAINISSQWDDWYAFAIDDFSDHNAFTKFRVNTGRNASSALPTQTPYVVKGLSDGPHTIMIVRRSEGISGVDTFRGLGLDTGKTLTAPSYSAPVRKMEFIGDSITCGSQNEYAAAVPTATVDLPCEWGGCVSNVDTAFGMQLARLYGAEGRVICRGGIGMYRNCSGCAPDYTMPQVFPYTYFENAPSGASLTWNFASWQPDVVVIALGTNDNPNPAIQADFQNAYTGFLTSLRTFYPNA